MRGLPESASEPFKNSAAHPAAELLHYYGFELDGYTVEEQLCSWLEHYSTQWITMAIIEALYQGRYKAISVGQILVLWQRRGQPLCHFNHEFERLICNRFPRTLVGSPEVSSSNLAQERCAIAFQQPVGPYRKLSYRKMLLQLPSVKATSKLERLTEIPSLRLTPLSTLNGMEPAQQSIQPTREASGLPAKDGSSDNVSGKPLAVNAELAEPVETKVIANSPIDTPDNSTSLTAIPNPPESLNASNHEFKRFKEGVVFALSSGLAAHSLNPKLKLELSKFLHLDWQQFMHNYSPIDQFVPELESSEFHSKLRSVAQSSEEDEGNANDK
ncbi:MAG: hypothetical protein HC866_18260 [Leptolyngbyaceae cyanobacterium RU_5_1]|nr:hypothetical protein [Leptolyngbyaceae cyanobacterium RU_5_1]